MRLGFIASSALNLSSFPSVILGIFLPSYTSHTSRPVSTKPKGFPLFPPALQAGHIQPGRWPCLACTVSSKARNQEMNGGSHQNLAEICYFKSIYLTPCIGWLSLELDMLWTQTQIQFCPSQYSSQWSATSPNFAFSSKRPRIIRQLKKRLLRSFPFLTLANTSLFGALFFKLLKDSISLSLDVKSVEGFRASRLKRSSCWDRGKKYSVWFFMFSLVYIMSLLRFADSDLWCLCFHIIHFCHIRLLGYVYWWAPRG